MNKKEMVRALVAAQQTLLDTAKAAEREMTEAETKSFNDLQKQIDALNADIAAEEKALQNPISNEKALEIERARVSDITAICREFGAEDSVDSYIKNGTSVDEVRAAILDKLKTERGAISAGSVDVGTDEADKFRAAAVDGLVLRSGVNLAATADGANDFRSMSLRDLAIECKMREGESAQSLVRMSSPDLYSSLCRDFYNPTAAFPAIMDATIRKSIVELYNKVPTTFQAWTTKGSLPDFKTTADHEYVIGGVGDFLKVPENGEIKADRPRTELLPSRQLDTYGKSFSMTRQAFINDDISFVSKVPGLYATKAKQTIDKQCYKILFDNPAIFDGQKLFHADHKNLIQAGSKPTQAAIQEIILQMQKQVDQFGEAIYINPSKLVVPMGYEFDLAVIFGSTKTTIATEHDNAMNPLLNYPLQIIQSPVLNVLAGAGDCPWFMIADEASARGIQVDYLNGQETPTVQRYDGGQSGVLGFTWMIYLDWGIAVRDFRGMAKNPGAKL